MKRRELLVNSSAAAAAAAVMLACRGQRPFRLTASATDTMEWGYLSEPGYIGQWQRFGNQVYVSAIIDLENIA